MKLSVVRRRPLPPQQTRASPDLGLMFKLIGGRCCELNCIVLYWFEAAPPAAADKGFARFRSNGGRLRAGLAQPWVGAYGIYYTHPLYHTGFGPRYSILPTRTLHHHHRDEDDLIIRPMLQR